MGLQVKPLGPPLTSFECGDDAFQCGILSVHSFQLRFPKRHRLSLYAAGSKVIAQQKNRHETKRDGDRDEITCSWGH